MAFVFPQDKQDFKAANGITYTYRDGKWLVKTFKDAPPDLSGFVTTENFEQDQNRQDSEIAGERSINETQDDQINLLETQIQLLAQARAVGKWKYVRNVSNGPRPPANTTFYATNGIDSSFVVRDWADARLLMIDKTDLKGTNYSFTNFEEGDKVEILDTDGSSACYGTVTNQPNVETYGNLIIAVERSTSGPRDDKEYVISVYRPGAVSGDVDLDILDDRYLVKTGDTMTGQLKLQEQPLKFMKSDGSNQIKIAPNSSAGDYWNNIWAFNCLDNGTTTGGMRFRVAENDDVATYKTFMSATYRDNPVGSTVQPVEVQLNWLRTPTLPHHASNKQYVDDEVKKITAPPELLWRRVNKGAEELEIGEFYISSGNNNIYMHPKAIGGIDLNMNRSADKVTGIKHLVSAHKYNGTINYSIVCTEISFNNGSNNYIRLTASEVLCDDYTDNDQQCRLNIPGFTF